MPIKIFTTIDGPCPFGTGCAIDSSGCRKCEWYFRQGTGTFFWCKHPPGAASKPKNKEKAVAGETPKRGRPRKAQPAKPKRKRQSLPKKGKERPIKTIKQLTK